MIKRCLIAILLLLISFTAVAKQSGIQPLALNQAFQFSAMATNNQTIVAVFKIAPGYYLYRQRFEFKAIKPVNTLLGQPLLPDGSLHRIAGTTYQVYKNIVKIPVPVIKTSGQDLVLHVSYQGCAAAGYCYPPTTEQVIINLAGHYGRSVTGTPVTTNPATTKAASAFIQKNKRIIANPHDQATRLFQQDNWLWLFVSFLGFGILIAFTPCVLPMIPILSGIIIGQQKISHQRSFVLSLAYVLGMAITYAIAGLLIGLAGASIQALMQQTWIIILFSLIFVAMALSMFGFYNIELPATWRSKLAHLNQAQHTGTLVGTFIMGVFSTLILSPCVTPPLVAALSYISHSGNATLGAIALFIMGIGMGIPLLLIGLFGPKLLPKTGAWMNRIKTLMGLMMLAVAIWMLMRILPGIVTMLLWAGLAIITGVYLGALSSSQSRWRMVSKIIGLLIFIYGIVLVIGAFMGQKDPLSPLPLNRATPKVYQQTFTPVPSLADFQHQLTQPQNRNRLVLLDFSAKWCIACKELEHFTFGNAKVQQALRQFVLLRADVTANNANDKAMEQHFGVVAPPTIIFFNRQHKEIQGTRIIGYMPAKAFLTHLEKVEQTSNS